MDNKVNAYMHKLLHELYYDCMSVIDHYERAKRLTSKPEERALSFMGDTAEDIDNALEVFYYADMITAEELNLCDFCKKRMIREAQKLLWNHIKEAV